MSDDCISRQAVIDVFKDAIGDKYPFICEPILITLSLIPSVTPKNTLSAEAYMQVMRERDIAIQQLNELGYEFGEKIEQPKTGHWIPFEYGDDTWHKCTSCGCADKYITEVQRPNGTIGRLKSIRNFCPICGCRMVEPQERSE